MVAEDIIIRPIITEKTLMAKETEGKYTFEVSKKATKIDIKNAVEKLFEVKVIDVTTMNMKGKPKRQGVHVGKTSDWKKAVVTIDTNPNMIEFKNSKGEKEFKQRKYLTKGGKEATSNKEFKTSIEGFGV